MVFGFALGAATEVLIVSPLGTQVAARRVRRADRRVPRHQRLRRGGRWGAPPQETMPSLFPSEPDDFVRILGTVWRWDDIGTLVVDAASSPPACSCCSRRPRSAWRCGRSPATRSRASSSASRRARSSPARGGSPVRSAPSPACSSPGRRRRSPDVMFTVFVYGSVGGDARRARQPARRRRRRARHRRRRERRRRVVPGVDRPGDEAVRRPAVHLRRAARQAVGPVRHREGGARMTAAAARCRRGSTRARSRTGRCALIWVRPPSPFVVLHPDEGRGEHDRRHDARLAAGDGGDVAQPGDGLRRDRLARLLGVLRPRRLHDGGARRPLRLVARAGRCTSPPSSASSSAVSRRCRRCG